MTDSKQYYEVNFDGIPGPTHIFAGLANGNLASETNEGRTSNPKAAALQSLEKIKFVSSLGIKQAIIPPQRRPDIKTMNICGFHGDKYEVLKKVYDENHDLFKAIFSSSNMWTANAATVSPSPDTQNGKLHLTAANLHSNFHRSIEAFPTFDFLRKNFNDICFSIQSPIASLTPDEGAANHLRLCKNYGDPGIEVFVYGYSNENQELPQPEHFKPRQSLEACQKIFDLHQLKIENTVFAQQNPIAIDAGVFHNDVISTCNQNFFLYHEHSFVNQEQTIREINNKYFAINNEELILHQVNNNDLSLEEVVSSYLFNSQILSLPEGQGMLMLAPIECQENNKVRLYIDKLINDPTIPLCKVEYIDLRQSMQNGGGPACLRLRVVMNEEEIQAVKPKIFFNEIMYEDLKAWINKFYPEKLTLADLLEKDTIDHIDEAFNILSTII